jgi:uncharacterized membrane protein YbhN (UPF0104 family)
VAILGVLIWRSNPREVWESLGEASAGAIAAVVLLNIPATLLRAARARRVLLCLGSAVPMRRMVPVQLAGQTLSWLTPAASGDLSRAWFWHRQDDVPLTDGVVTVLYERVYSLLLLAVVGAACLAPGALGPVGSLVTVAVVALAAMLPWFTATTAIGRATGRLVVGGVARLPGLRSRSAVVARSGRDLSTLFASRRLGAEFTLLTLGVLLVSGLQVLLLVDTLGAGVGLAVAIAVYGLSQAGSSVSSLPFGIGVGDAIVVGLLTARGMSFDSATAVAVLLRATVTLPIAAAAVVVAPQLVWRAETPAIELQAVAVEVPRMAVDPAAAARSDAATPVAAR